ncbi:MAG: T9SS type A sorting domain-containing protein, partial [Saprospiraceae bacterium]|nr:T9SS type A sorting domain-containing protein [Saprospiraceae bacterium]
RFDNFLITTEASLPVELSRFDSRLIRKQTHLNWATESETDNDYFAVERSADGRQYTEIGRVPGAGTTREPQSYGFVDPHPQKGLNYYRLRQVDLDGRLNFSPVRVVALDEWLDVRLFPSPAAAWLELNWSEPVESVITWQILDPAGRQIESGLLPEAGTRSTLALQHLAPGSYLLRLSDGQRSWSQIFLKN